MSHMEDEYVTQQARSGFPAVLAGFEEASVKVASRLDAVLDERYGSLERQRFDFFPSHEPPLATIVYFHAGYWQSRDKSTFRFLANAFNEAGLNAAFVNYPLCPDVSVAEIIDAAALSLPVIAQISGELPLILAGHSAGGHIAVELAMRQIDRKPDVIAVLSISGVFDLRPLVETTLNERLRLDDAAAEAASPLLRVLPNAPKAVFAVGGDETEAFLKQNLAMADAWASAGNIAHHHVASNADHFTVLSHLMDRSDPLVSLMRGLIPD